MSDTISAIGAKTQAPPVQQLVRPSAATSADGPEPNKPVEAAGAGNSAVSSGAAVGAAPETGVAAAVQNGPAAQSQEGYQQQAPEEKQPLTEGQAQQAAESFKSYVEKLPGEMKFTIDHDTKRQVFKIINPVTQEVVKQFPPDEFLTMIKRLKEIGPQSKDNGIFLDEKS